ncbi:sulfatase [Actinoplanes sp. NPDC051861]|uniref:sulfatase family protein n=1 Tax=Actinoplanes sp. NPDC051861 TaxID=3155170 RepID=UPI0034450EFB
MSSRPRRVIALLLAASLSLVSACSSGPDAVAPAASSPAARTESVSAPPIFAPTIRPNIVFVLVDDLSMNLVRYMPNVLALQRAGTSFTNYTVTDSLCCPSRASMLTGRYPHNTGIIKNHGSDGGFQLFHRRGEERSTFATDLQKAGYRTAFLGKYLNEYVPRKTIVAGKPYVPPGWTEWYAGGNDYTNYNYTLNENGVLRSYGSRPQDYLTDVLSAKASRFITTSAAARKPFFVEVSTYAPHHPYTPAPRDVNAFPGLKAPRTPAFGKVPVNAPRWLAKHSPLTAIQMGRFDRAFRLRVQSIQAVDRMIGSLRATLTRAGVAEETVVVFSSDNGYHLGEYRLNAGKQTAFDTDVNVPLVAAGHGVAAGHVSALPVENIDLRPTFAELAGAVVPAEVDGRSIVPLLAGSSPESWRVAALIEHGDPATDPADPDYQKYSENTPPTYDALRTASFTYVENVDGTREYYDRRSDPYQMLNLAGKLDPERLTELSAALRRLARCEGAASCWAASVF